MGEVRQAYASSGRLMHSGKVTTICITRCVPSQLITQLSVEWNNALEYQLHYRRPARRPSERLVIQVLAGKQFVASLWLGDDFAGDKVNEGWVIWVDVVYFLGIGAVDWDSYVKFIILNLNCGSCWCHECLEYTCVSMQKFCVLFLNFVILTVHSFIAMSNVHLCLSVCENCYCQSVYHPNKPMLMSEHIDHT